MNEAPVFQMRTVPSRPRMTSILMEWAMDCADGRSGRIHQFECAIRPLNDAAREYAPAAAGTLRIGIERLGPGQDGCWYFGGRILNSPKGADVFNCFCAPRSADLLADGTLEVRVADLAADTEETVG